MPAFTSKFAVRDKVCIDRDLTSEGAVTGVMFRGVNDCPQIEVGWMHNGASASAWFPEWRVDLAEVVMAERHA